MKRHLQYHWWQYLLAVLLPILIWCAAFDAASKPKQNERLRILFVGECLDVQALQDDLSEQLPQMTEQPLKEIRVTQMQPEGMALGELLTARQFDYDIVILTQTDCQATPVTNFFRPLSDAVIDQFPASTPYTEPVEDKTLSFGFVLSGKTHFASYLTEQADCVLFFSAETVNLDGMNGKGSAGNDAALRAAEYLLGEWD